MSHLRDKDAVCPFFIRSDDHRIICEGLELGEFIHDNKIHLVFGNSNKLTEYFETHCKCIHKCNECLINRMLNRKYEEGSDVQEKN